MRTQKKVLSLALIGLIFCSGIGVGLYLKKAEAAPAQKPRIYELRTYTTNDGKLDALHSRFSDHTNGLFVKHGMTLIGYWTHAEGDNVDDTLVYLIAHEDRDVARANWRAFGSDEEWRKAYAASREDGALVKKVESQFLVPTDYSPLR